MYQMRKRLIGTVDLVDDGWRLICVFVVCGIMERVDSEHVEM